MNISVNIGVKNDDDYENNDKIEDIKNGLLDDFNDLISFEFSENPFKAPNLSIDRRLKTVFWFRPTVYTGLLVKSAIFGPTWTVGHQMVH